MSSEEEEGIPEQYGKDSTSDQIDRNINKISNKKLLFKKIKEPDEVLNDNPYIDSAYQNKGNHNKDRMMKQLTFNMDLQSGLRNMRKDGNTTVNKDMNKKHQFYNHEEATVLGNIDIPKTKSAPSSPVKKGRSPSLASPRKEQRHEYGTPTRSLARRVMCKHSKSTENLWISGRIESYNRRVSKKYVCRY